MRTKYPLFVLIHYSAMYILVNTNINCTTQRKMNQCHTDVRETFESFCLKKAKR